MRYDRPELIEILCAEYVLGTLKGNARRRFEQLLVQKPAWAQATQWWERHLNLLMDTIPTKQPPARVWRNINAQLFAKPASRWSGMFKLFSAALLASVATFLVVQFPKEISPESNAAVAMLSDKTAQSGWHLSVGKTEQGKVALSAYSLTGLVQRPTAAYELWLLPEHNAKPISLGLLPQQGHKPLLVSAALLPQLKRGNLAVSVEPIGGSPTGQPTGEVVYQGKLFNIQKGFNS